MQKCFPDHPEWLQATLEIDERCNLQLELGKLIIPEFTVPEGETPDSYLQKLSIEGALKRYHLLTQEVRSRLTRELEVIKKWSLAPYFLLVLDIVKKRGGAGFRGGARVGGKLHRDVLSGHFLRVSVALGCTSNDF